MAGDEVSADTERKVACFITHSEKRSICSHLIHGSSTMNYLWLWHSIVGGVWVMTSSHKGFSSDVMLRTMDRMKSDFRLMYIWLYCYRGKKKIKNAFYLLFFNSLKNAPAINICTMQIYKKKKKKLSKEFLQKKKCFVPDTIKWFNGNLEEKKRLNREWGEWKQKSCTLYF